MTVILQARAQSAADETTGRFRLHRAGILNVWQYDDQEFQLADGRLLLRGANGAGKSKTLEMLLPFALDGDKTRLTASGRHHTSLLWLMTDGYDGQARVGYVWVEFVRPLRDGGVEAFTCGVGIRASTSARSATAWFFATDRRIGHDLQLEDEAGPLSRPRLEEALGAEGQVFDKAAAYKEHVGRSLFGLAVPQYDEVLRLLYWLRQPQVGEDIEPARLSIQLAQALPQLDEQAIKAAGDTFDELTAFGEQIERRTAAAEALTELAASYSRYARASAASRARAVLDAVKEERRLRSAVRQGGTELDELVTRGQTAESALAAARREAEGARRGIAELEASPEARDQRRLAELAERADVEAGLAGSARERAISSGLERDRRRSALEQTGDRVLVSVAEHRVGARELGARLRETADPGPSVRARVTPAALDDPRLARLEDAGGLSAAVEASREALVEAGAAVRQRQAAVEVVRAAVDQLTEARRLVAERERNATETEQRWEEARAHRAEADAQADELEGALFAALQAWTSEAGASVLEAPRELTPGVLDGLAGQADAAAAPHLADLRTRAQAAATARDRAASMIAELAARRAEVEAEHEPAPPGPFLPRTERTDGAALWRLVEFADVLSEQDRAGLEAALQAAGLLDAWVRPDGQVLSPDAYDVVLTPGTAVEGATLADVLRADPSADSDVSAGVVESMLRRVRLGGRDGASAVPFVATDGSWALGPLEGRATKERAQHIGATARAQERRRRLDELDLALASQQDARVAAEAELTALTTGIDDLTDWLRRLPDLTPMRQAWTRVDERRDVETKAEGLNASAQALAHRARDEAAARLAEVQRVAASHDLPSEAGALAAVEERLRALGQDLTATARSVPPLVRDLERWTADFADLERVSQRAEADVAEADRLADAAEATSAAVVALREAVGATVRELEERIAHLRRTLADHRAQEQRSEDERVALSEMIGKARETMRQAGLALAEHVKRRSMVLARFAALASVPGLLESAAGSGSPEADAAVLAGAVDVPAGEPLPPVLVSVARALSDHVPPTEEADVNLVWRSYNDAGSGPAADHEPRVAEHGDLLALTGRGEAGELPVGQLAPQVTAAVESDRALLTARERERFEQHVLGELGDAIRRCRVEAVELVNAMNRLLSGVSTSQGIRMRLDWRLRDDVPTEARRAVELLGQPIGALLPDERSELRDALHRLIEASRGERPELGYSEHLAAALDYRSWFVFRVRYTRPENDGVWQDLHRRSPLSQGEQKVLCYLPLFAAAAAHFTSLAGAAPHAPRLVLLDDAFPKIDVRTHPLLFGLLVQLDLDFVITSERLWGDHETVPSLAIYEALRDPAQRGIAQYQYRWDGRQLRSLG